jgi:hypothetical protein
MPRSWAERAYPKLIHDNKLDKGGHFAAWERPQLFSYCTQSRRAAEIAASVTAPSAPLRICVKVSVVK